jgi:hypothetical protein
VADVTVATFSGVEIDRAGKVTINPNCHAARAAVKAAAARLKGRSTRLSIKLTLARQGVKATRTVTVTVRPARGRPGVWVVA